MAGRDGSDDMFPADLPSIPRMRKSLAPSSTNPVQGQAPTKRRIRSSSVDSDAEAENMPRRIRKKRFASAPLRKDRGRPDFSEKSAESSSDGTPRSGDSDAMDDVTRGQLTAQAGGRKSQRTPGRSRRLSKRSSESDSEGEEDEEGIFDGDDGGNGSTSEEGLAMSRSEKLDRKRQSSSGSFSEGLGSDGENEDSGSDGSDERDDARSNGNNGSRLESNDSSDSDSNDPSTSGNGSGKMQSLRLNKPEEKGVDDYSEDESLGSEEELPGKAGDSGTRLTVRQRAMQGEDIGSQLTKLTSPRHKKKRKPPSEDLTKDEEKAIKLQQKARLRHMVHEKRNKEKRAAMVDKVLRGVTSKRKKLSLAAETYVAEAGARLAKNSARDDCYRYTSTREGSYVSIPESLEAPTILASSQHVSRYPLQCERDPKTGKRVLPSGS